MGIVNRTLDPTEQVKAFNASYQVVATGITLQALVVPYASVLKAITTSCEGISGSPAMDMRVWRFIVGTGVTTIAGGATTLTLVTNGTSGNQSVVLAASGSSFLNLLSGDVITWTTSGANSAVGGLSMEIVIQAVQDIRKTIGVS